jgi:hypothetical protein
MPVTTVTTTSSQVVGNSEGRVSLTFRNDSASNDIYLGSTGSGVSTTQYEYHLKAGDAVNFNLIEDGDLPSRSWYAIASGTGSSLSYMEGNIHG